MKNLPQDILNVILEFDGKPIDSINKLPRIVGDTQIDKKVDIVVFRDGKKQTLSAVVAKPDREDPFNNDVDSSHQKSTDKNTKVVLGVKVANLTDETRRMYSIDSSSKGIVVTDIEKNSIMAFTGVRAGDVIITVNSKTINNIDDFEKAFEYSNKSLILAKKVNSLKVIKSASYNLYKIFKKQNKFKVRIKQ